MKAAVEDEAQGSLLTQIAHALHEMCQPLTALQCRLEMEEMERQDTGPPGSDAVLGECLRECERLSARVHGMRALLRRALTEERENAG